MSQTLPEVPCNNPTQFCRLCFSRQNIHWVIRTNGTEVDLPFINTIGSCLGVWLKLDEDFPCAVCRKCTTEIERIIEFRENCRLCDEALKQKRQNDPTALVLFYDFPEDRVFMNVLPKPGFDEADDRTSESELILPEVVLNEDSPKQEPHVVDGLQNYEKRLALTSYFESYSRWSQRMLEAKDDDERTVVAPESLEQENQDQNDSVVNPMSVGWCCLCRRNFHTATKLKNHLALKHYQNDGFYCVVCGKKLRTYPQLREHALRHDTKLMISCEKCGKKFPTHQQLKEHALRHEKKLMISCEKCGIQFRRSHELDAHRKMDNCRVRTPMYCKCRYCDRMFSNKGRYIFHLKALHSDKPLPDLSKQHHHVERKLRRPFRNEALDRIITDTDGKDPHIEKNGRFVVCLGPILPHMRNARFPDRKIENNKNTLSRTVESGRIMVSLDKLSDDDLLKMNQHSPTNSEAQIIPEEVICTICFVQFHDLLEFNIHLKQCRATVASSLASSPKPFELCQCEICIDIVDEHDQFSEHLQHHGCSLDVKLHDCSLCTEWRLSSTQETRLSTPPLILGD
ncbi:zinc finger protein 429-like [Malaya genurostris]|uniref:zinc finger protein 429-like n=1 Tax=Malaya genurostris TaxID=325434 RepID=UPI0026F3B465|nr:zinc finger protein 429-like [Malaya genurostris]